MAYSTGFKISRLNNIYDKYPKPYPLSVIFKEIREGKTTIRTRGRQDNKTLEKYTESTRSKRNIFSKENYDTLKKDLPQITPACTLENRSEIKHFSNLVCLEYDDEAIDYPLLIANATQNPHVVSVFRSISNKAKILVHVSSENLNTETYKHAWNTAAEMFEEYGDADEAARSPTQTQAYCYDPNIYVNLEALPLLWEIDDTLETTSHGDAAAYQGTLSVLGDLYESEILKIEEYKPNGWSKTAIPCPFTSHEHDAWDSKTNGTYVRRNGDSDYTLHCFKCGEIARYAPKQRNYRRLHVNTEKPIDDSKLEDIEIVRKALNKDVIDWYYRTSEIQIDSDFWNSVKSLPETEFYLSVLSAAYSKQKAILILEHSAGTGKSTAAILNIDRMLSVAPTQILADEQYQNALLENKHAGRMRTRLDNINEPNATRLGLGENERPCLYPVECNTLAQKGHNARLFCSLKCEHHEDCKEYGYLSQKMSGYNQIYTSLPPEYITDSRFSSYVRTLFHDQTDDRVAFIDDCNIEDLPQKRYFDINHLARLAKDYDVEYGTYNHTVEFLTSLIQQVSTATTETEFKESIQKVLQAYDVKTKPSKENQEIIAMYKKGYSLENIIEYTGYSYIQIIEILQTDEASRQLQIISDTLSKIPVEISFEKITPIYDLEGKVLTSTAAEIKHRDKTVTCAVVKESDRDVFYTISDMPTIPDTLLPDGKITHGIKYPKLIDDWMYFRLFDSLRDLTSIENINVLAPKNLVEDLKRFTRAYPHHAPAQKDNTNWTFYLPPTLNVRRAIFSSASGWSKLIKGRYEGKRTRVEISEGMTKLHPSTRVYQLPFGILTPAQSLFEKDNRGIPHALRKRGKELLDLIHTVATHTQHKILVAAPACFSEDGTLSHLPEIARLHELDNVSMISQKKGIGINTYEDYDICFIFNFQPHADEVKLTAKKYLKGHISFEREQTDFSKAGLVLENVNRYTDERVQEIFDLLSEKVMMQNAMRLRPNLYPNKAIFFLTSEPVNLGQSEISPPFESQQLLEFVQENQTVHGFDEFLGEQKERTPQDLMENDRLSQSQAYEKTKDKRKQDNAERDKTVLEMYNQGNTQAEIVRQLNLNKSTVSRIIKKAQGK